MNIANSITMDKQPINKPFSSLSPKYSTSIITHPGYHIRCSKFGQKKHWLSSVFVTSFAPLQESKNRTQTLDLKAFLTYLVNFWSKISLTFFQTHSGNSTFKLISESTANHFL